MDSGTTVLAIFANVVDVDDVGEDGVDTASVVVSVIPSRAEEPDDDLELDDDDDDEGPVLMPLILAAGGKMPPSGLTVPSLCNKNV